MDIVVVGLVIFQLEVGWVWVYCKGSFFKFGLWFYVGVVGLLQGISCDIVELVLLFEFECLQCVFKKGDVVEVCYVVWYLELGWCWLLMCVVLGLLVGGWCFILVVMLDVMVQVQVENVLLLWVESECVVLDFVFVGIVIVGLDGIEWMNCLVWWMFGCELEDVLGQLMGVFVFDDVDYFFYVELGVEVFECWLCGCDGCEFWVIGNVVQMLCEDGVIQLIYVLLDIDCCCQVEVQSCVVQVLLVCIIEVVLLVISLYDVVMFNIVKFNQVVVVMVGCFEDILFGYGLVVLFGDVEVDYVCVDMCEVLEFFVVV